MHMKLANTGFNVPNVLNGTNCTQFRVHNAYLANPDPGDSGPYWAHAILGRLGPTITTILQAEVGSSLHPTGHEVLC